MFDLDRETFNLDGKKIKFDSIRQKKIEAQRSAVVVELSD